MLRETPIIPPAEDGVLSAADYYKIVRGQIEHEDNLIGQRLSWFVASQSFLFTAYAIALSNMQSDKPIGTQVQLHLLLVIVPVVAMLTCALILLAIIAGVLAIQHLKRLYRTWAQAEHRVGLPPVVGYRHTQVFGLAAPLLLPAVFLGVWLILLVGDWIRY